MHLHMYYVAIQQKESVLLTWFDDKNLFSVIDFLFNWNTLCKVMEFSLEVQCKIL